jgi:tRNA U34 5-carboxymethylaminomethyl modifying GTPase MnmE/TrmE
MKDNKEFIKKLIDHNTEGFRKIAHSKFRGSAQEQYLQAQREVLFKKLWKIEDTLDNA